MIIISNNNCNENTNSISIDFEGTQNIGTICGMPKVRAFFGESMVGDIVDGLATVDGLDVDVVGDVSTLSVDSTSELIFDLFGEAQVQAATAEAEAAFITVSLSGGFNQKRVPIAAGQTRLGDIITADLAHFFAMTVDGIHSMKLTVNDVEVDSTYVLGKDDFVMIQPRKAGDKGSCIRLCIRGANRCVVFQQRPVYGESVADFLGKLFENVAFHLVEINSEPVSPAFENVIAQNTPATDQTLTIKTDSLLIGLETRGYPPSGIDFTFPVEATFTDIFDILNRMPALDGIEYDVEMEKTDTATAVKLSVNFPLSEDSSEADDDLEDYEEVQEDEILGGEPVGKFGAVKIARAGGFNALEIGIKNGVTTLGDIIAGNKFLSAFAMTEDQARSLKYTVDDVELGFGDTLHIGDVIMLQPRKAGGKAGGKGL